LPLLNLAFEYQGEQHYGVSGLGKEFYERLMARDDEKKIICKENGINLIEVDYRWNGSTEQLHDYIDRKIILPKRKAPHLTI